MAVADTKPLDELLTFIREHSRDDMSLSDVVRLAEISTETFQAFFSGMDSAVLREMREIADYITAMKREIGALQVNEIKNRRLPAAGQELDAVLKATEEATNCIMSCAEAVMEADAADASAYKALVDEKMMVIFEACSFQDITGQRIAKVFETLQHIDTRVSRFAKAMRAQDIEGPVTEAERASSERKLRLLVHGPQLVREANTQEHVDRVMRPAKNENSQSEIDALFA
jgi:chemotaxis protein CheZ